MKTTPNDSAAVCEWGRMSKTGKCGAPSVCLVDDSEGKPVKTCDRHMRVALRQGWQVIIQTVLSK